MIFYRVVDYFEKQSFGVTDDLEKATNKRNFLAARVKTDRFIILKINVGKISEIIKKEIEFFKNWEVKK